MNITLRQLSVFAATARFKQITQAAEELCMTQSAASQSIKELENTLNYKIFRRAGKKLHINENGRAILSKVTQMLELQAQLQQPISSNIQGELFVAASVTIGSYLMPKILAEFVRQYPLMEPKLHICNSEEVIEQLLSGKAQIGLIEAPIAHKDLIVTPWRSDQLVIFCANNHLLAKLERATFESICNYQWILREHGSGTRSVFVSALHQQGKTIKNSMDLTRQEAIKQAVKEGLGVGVLSQLSIQEELKLNIFKKLELPLNLSRQFSIVQSEHYQHNNPLKIFEKFLHNYFRQEHD